MFENSQVSTGGVLDDSVAREALLPCMEAVTDACREHARHGIWEIKDVGRVRSRSFFIVFGVRLFRVRVRGSD